MDTESLLRSLNAREVRYVVIGATAFPVHGYARATLDIDVFIEATPENVRRTLAALWDVGYDVTDVTVDDLLTKKLLIRQYVRRRTFTPLSPASRSMRSGVITSKIASARRQPPSPAWTTY